MNAILVVANPTVAALAAGLIAFAVAAGCARRRTPKRRERRETPQGWEADR
jgi:hypothetical protein